MIKRPNSNYKLFGLLGRYLLLGVATGWLLLFGIFALDIAGLRSMTQSADVEIIVYPLMMVFFAITFGSAAMGIGIMGLKDDDDDFTGGHKFKTFDKLAKVSATARSKNTQIRH